MRDPIIKEPTSNFTIDSYILDSLKNGTNVPKLIFNTRIKYSNILLIINDILVHDLDEKVQPHDVASIVDTVSSVIKAGISRAILMNGFSVSMLESDALVIYEGCKLFIELELERYSLLSVCNILDKEIDGILVLIKSILKDLVKQLTLLDKGFREVHDMLSFHNENIYEREYAMCKVYANEILSIARF